MIEFYLRFMMVYKNLGDCLLVNFLLVFRQQKVHHKTVQDSELKFFKWAWENNIKRP